ncbi:MAG: hypothetical protein KKE23_01510 [Nanoarchaeota archaeon]|nr:hypothetical protein [Nanoarchaeota archaeon]
MQEVNKPVDPEEIIARLDRLIEFFEKYAQNHDEKECPNSPADRKRGIREPAKPGNRKEYLIF